MRTQGPDGTRNIVGTSQFRFPWFPMQFSIVHQIWNLEPCLKSTGARTPAWANFELWRSANTRGATSQKPCKTISGENASNMQCARFQDYHKHSTLTQVGWENPPKRFQRVDFPNQTSETQSSVRLGQARYVRDLWHTKSRSDGENIWAWLRNSTTGRIARTVATHH